ncbi:MAG TPA: hypothetical protein VGL86_25965, partial [Polyangia bacterium]
MAPDVWAAKLLDQLEPNQASPVEPIEEPVDEEVDESAWQVALAAAHARANAEEAPAIEAEPASAAEVSAEDNDGIADETGPHETLTAEVPKEALESLLADPANEPSTDVHAERAAHEPPPIPEAAIRTAPGIAPAYEAPAHEAPAHEASAHEAPAHVAHAASREELLPLVELLRAGRCVLCAGPRLGDSGLAIRDVLARLVAALPSADVREVWPLLQARP